MGNEPPAALRCGSCSCWTWTRVRPRALITNRRWIPALGVGTNNQTWDRRWTQRSWDAAVCTKWWRTRQQLREAADNNRGGEQGKGVRIEQKVLSICHSPSLQCLQAGLLNLCAGSCTFPNGLGVYMVGQLWPCTITMSTTRIEHVQERQQLTQGAGFRCCCRTEWPRAHLRYKCRHKIPRTTNVPGKVE